MSASDDHVSAGYEFLRDSMYHAALTEFKQAEELNPNNAMVHYYLGHTYWRLDMATKAQAAFECALRLKPNDAQLLLDVGVFYLDCGQESKAIMLVDRACELSTGAGTNSFAQARLAYSRKDYPEALRHYQEAHKVLQSVALLPDASASSLYNFASCERRLGNQAAAIELLERATEIDPYDYSVYATLAGLHLQLHNLEGWLSLRSTNLPLFQKEVR